MCPKSVLYNKWVRYGQAEVMATWRFMQINKMIKVTLAVTTVLEALHRAISLDLSVHHSSKRNTLLNPKSRAIIEGRVYKTASEVAAREG